MKMLHKFQNLEMWYLDPTTFRKCGPVYCGKKNAKFHDKIGFDYD